MKRTDKTKRLIVISLDAVGKRDLKRMEDLPNFGRFFKRAAVCRNVESVYPSLTYPAHASIVTGCYPKNHGIVNNLRFQPGREQPDWFWQRRFVKRTTLYDEAEKRGLKTAALLWPVTGGAKISYNLPEIWANRPWQNQITVSLMNGSPEFQWDVYSRFGSMLDGVKQPALDSFVQAAFLHTLKKYQPDLSLVHFTDVDSHRHDFGVDSPEADEALLRHDSRLGEILDLLEEMGWQNDTNLVLLGDHYQKDTCKVSYPNYYLKKLGWLKAKGNKVTSWRVVARECGGSCYIYLRRKKDRGRVRKWLDAWERRSGSPVERIYEGKEAAAMGADPDCDFMLEAAEGWYFQNDLEKAWERAERQKDPSFHLGNHGYHPAKPGYWTFFAGAGPDFVPGAEAGYMSLIDEGPTLARLLGIELPGADGKAVLSLLRESR